MIGFGFVLTVLYVPGILSAATEPRYWLIFAVTALLLAFREVTRLTSGHWLGLAFLALAALSMLWTPVRYDGLYHLAHLALLGMVFTLGAETTDIRPLLKGMALGLALNGFLQAVQLVMPYRWAYETFGIWENVSPAGTFINARYLAETAALVAVGCAAYRLWFWLLLALPGVLLPSVHGQSVRGVYAALLVLGLAWLATRQKIISLILVVALCATTAVVVGHPDRLASLEQRAGIMRGTWNGLTLTGQGIGSFFSTFPLQRSGINLVRERPDHAHCDLCEIAYELGPLGAALALVFVAFALAAPLRPERYVFGLFVLIGLTSFPLHFPAASFLGLLCAGRLYGAGDRLRELVRAGRISLRHGDLVLPQRSGEAVSSHGAGAALVPVQAGVPGGRGLRGGEPRERSSA